jgi:hypothetical protein
MIQLPCFLVISFVPLYTCRLNAKSIFRPQRFRAVAAKNPLDLIHIGYLNPFLVGGLATPLKNMTSSVGMLNFPTEWKVIKVMFQTTNQKMSNPN